MSTKNGEIQLPQLLTAAELSAATRCSENHIYALIKSGDIHPRYVKRFGRTIRIDAAFLTDTSNDKEVI